MKKRIFSLILAVYLTASLLAVPAGAAGTAPFSDVTDSEMAADVECLRLLGVLDGYADGSFRPNATLTRAQFCKMAVYAMNASAELGKYRAVTVFPDVKPGHWASSYINLASKGKGIILGFADGQFHPEATVTAGQAVTILMRLLDYKDEDVGAVWPDGYLAQAAVIGLTDGLSLSGGAALNRGQAARLFVNLLRCEKKDETAYAASIAASIVEHTMLVSSSASAGDGTDTGMQVGNGSTYRMANKTSGGLLNGRMGTLLLNKDGKVMTFVPDAVGSTRMTVVAKAEQKRLTDTQGVTYAMESDTAIYYNGEESTWEQVYSWLTAGTSVTLYLGASGGVEYVFAGGMAADQAIVVYEKGSTAGFDALTGGVTKYKILKNGAAASAGDLRPYDVATWSAATNTLRVCDVRLTGIYEDCYPNPDAPTKLTLMGHEFSVLPSAHGMLKDLKLGSSITLLLTEDNQVAGAVQAVSGSPQGNAVGIVRSGSVELLCGLKVSGTVSGGTAQLEGQLVKVASAKKGQLSLTALTGGVSGDLDVANRKVGSRELAENAVIFQRGTNGLEAVSLSQLSSAVISENQVRYARANWAGKVDIVVLGDRSAITEYIYGRIGAYSEDVEEWVPDPGHEDEPPIDGTNGHYEKKDGRNFISVENNGGSYGPYRSNYPVKTGDYVKATLNSDRSRLTGAEKLTKVAGVPNSAWVGESTVNTGGRSYTVSANVACYNASTKTWITLQQAHAFAARCDLFVDDSGIVRAVEVKQ